MATITLTDLNFNSVFEGDKWGNKDMFAANILIKDAHNVPLVYYRKQAIDVAYTKYQSFVGTTINVDIYDDEKITDLEEDLIYPVVYYFDNMVHSHE